MLIARAGNEASRSATPERNKENASTPTENTDINLPSDKESVKPGYAEPVGYRLSRTILFPEHNKFFVCRDGRL